MPLNFQTFWSWLSQGVDKVPTLGIQQGKRTTPHYISAVVIDDSVVITAGNGTVQQPISRETAKSYIDDFLADTNQEIKGNKRYVIALYLYYSNII